jgi:tight adherence protein C
MFSIAASLLDNEWSKLLLVAVVVTGGWALVRIAMRQRAKQRLFARAVREDEVPHLVTPEGALERWLFMAGFRQPSSTTVFIAAESICAVVALALVPLALTSGVIARGADFADQLPGGLGAALVPLYSWSPWLAAVVILMLPVLFVRAARRERIELVEQDLPMTLELLASLAEAGQGMDASIQRILETQDDDRPLNEELARFRAESLSGLSRKQCFKNLSERLDIASVSVFVSALTHAEEVGAGTSATLRRQADELWSRRRETVLAQSQLLPTRLAVPLVVCFLPGILAVTIVPALSSVTGMMPGAGN